MKLVCLPKLQCANPSFTHVNKMLQFSTDLVIGEIYHTLCHINIIPCVTANLSWFSV